MKFNREKSTAKLDVVIVGASAAGLFAAEQLARAGKHVSVFEQHTDPLPARRTLIITPQLQKFLNGIPPAAVQHRIGAIRVAMSDASLCVELQNADLVIERRQLSAWLTRRAREAGAEIHYGYRFQNFKVYSGCTEVQVLDREGRLRFVSAAAIIGADGAFSDVARAANLCCPPTVPIVQAEVRLPRAWDPSLTQIWFHTDETRFFYWLIPESAERGVVGLVADDRSKIRQLLQRFLDRHQLEPLSYQGGRVAMHHPQLCPWGQVGTMRVLLVGDAAGQVKVTTVGGTVTGLWGAQAAVRALLRGSPYARELRALKRELDLHWLMRLLLDRLDNSGYSRLIAQMSPRAQKLLRNYNRDEMMRAAWQLPLLQPSLLALGLRLLLGGRADGVTHSERSLNALPEHLLSGE